MRLLVLALAASAAVAMGCGGKVVVDGSASTGGAGGATSSNTSGTPTGNASVTSASSAAAGGAISSSTANVAVSATSATAVAVTAVASSSSGMMGCMPSSIDIVDNGIAVSFGTLCSGSWNGGNGSTSADAYIEQGGPAPGIEALNVDGCSSTSPNAPGIQLSISNVTGPGQYTQGTLEYTDTNGKPWTSGGAPDFQVSVNTFDPVGGVVEGNFNVEVFGGKLGKPLMGTFSVCRVSDEDLP